MFENIGKKIKNLAMVVTWIGIIGSIIIGIVLVVFDEEFMMLGLLLAVIGSFISWLSSFILYGFGELVDRTTMIFDIISGALGESVNTVKEEEADTSEALEAGWINGRCGICNKQTMVAAARIGEMKMDYTLCKNCMEAYKATPK